MIAEVALGFFNLLFTVLYFAIIARALVSWFPVDPYHPAVILLDQITEPFLAPIRRFVPSGGRHDDRLRRYPAGRRIQDSESERTGTTFRFRTLYRGYAWLSVIGQPRG